MARTRGTTPSSARRARATAALGPGLHPGTIELTTAEGEGEKPRSFRVRVGGEKLVSATLGPGVSPALAEECMREGRTVVLVDGPDGIRIAGALQTAPTIAPDAQGTLALEAKHLRVRAERSIAIEVPGGGLTLEQGGVVRMEGDKLVLDMAALVRIFSARVEIP
jgi:hypothetical protein